jgi:hypothetical protein
MEGKKEDHGKKLKRSYGKTKIHGEAWLSDNPLKKKMAREEKD